MSKNGWKIYFFRPVALYIFKILYYNIDIEHDITSSKEAVKMTIYELQRFTRHSDIADLPLRCSTYSRVSTEKETQAASLHNMTDDFRDYIERHKNWTFVKAFIDDGKSGLTTKKRKDFLNLLRRVLRWIWFAGNGWNLPALVVTQWGLTKYPIPKGQGYSCYFPLWRSEHLWHRLRHTDTAKASWRWERKPEN